MRALDGTSNTAGQSHSSLGEVTIVASADELGLLCNAINESLEAVEEWEFQTRLGNTREEALALHAQISSILGNLST